MSNLEVQKVLLKIRNSASFFVMLKAVNLARDYLAISNFKTIDEFVFIIIFEPIIFSMPLILIILLRRYIDNFNIKKIFGLLLILNFSVFFINIPVLFLYVLNIIICGITERCVALRIGYNKVWLIHTVFNFSLLLTALLGTSDIYISLLVIGPLITIGLFSFFVNQVVSLPNLRGSIVAIITYRAVVMGLREV